MSSSAWNIQSPGSLFVHHSPSQPCPCSHSQLTQRVEEMIEKFDDDNDGKLTKSEYVTDPYKDLETDEINLREKEFSLILDRNKDGYADKCVQY